MKTNTLTTELLHKMDAYWRAANYLSVGQVYLFDNPLLKRVHLVMDTIDRLPQSGDKGIYLKQQLQDELIEHKQYMDKNGRHLPEIRDWKGGQSQMNTQQPQDTAKVLCRKFLFRKAPDP